MIKFINKIIHKFLATFDYLLIKKEDIINFRLDDLKKSLEKNDLNNNYKNENLIAFISKNFTRSHSQIFQDLFVDYILKKEKGFYCEVGALDGQKFYRFFDRTFSYHNVKFVFSLSYVCYFYPPYVIRASR